ncbi:hypothetical protein AGDE_02597 [Angomonas deanei]|nr:hypothetical protein AGDE_02597 [Angomonas deanei]|eukprot:EPY41328.1 hypothetical protein AGDE_02597 [Angomonas deanei]
MIIFPLPLTSRRQALADSKKKNCKPYHVGSASQLPRGGGRTAGLLDKVKRQAGSVLSSDAPSDEPLLDVPKDDWLFNDLAIMAELTYTQRLIGFCMLLGMGIVFFLVAISLAPMIAFAAKKFAFFLTFGSVFILSSTSFIIGPKNQLKGMFESNRFEAACIYAVSVLCTLVCALYLKTSTGCILFAVLQVVALGWYALSFVPYARYTFKFIYQIVYKFLSTVTSVVRGLFS